MTIILILISLEVIILQDSPFNMMGLGLKPEAWSRPVLSTLVEEKLLSVERGHEEASLKSSTGTHIISACLCPFRTRWKLCFSDITFVGGAEMLASWLWLQMFLGHCVRAMWCIIPLVYRELSVWRCHAIKLAFVRQFTVYPACCKSNVVWVCLERFLRTGV